jgi:hypothetical protein
VTPRRQLEWSAVLFQPDLTAHKKPIWLGAILREMHSPEIQEIGIIGRAPRLSPRPSEFIGVTDVTMTILSKWPSAMMKDILDGGPSDVFERLASRWRWNLYITEMMRVHSAGTSPLEVVGRKLYFEHVGEHFQRPTIHRVKRRGVPSVPARIPAWKLAAMRKEEISAGAV